MCPDCGNKLIMSRNNGMQGYRCAHCVYTEDVGGGALDGYTEDEYSQMRQRAIADPNSPAGWVKSLKNIEAEYQRSLR